MGLAPEHLPRSAKVIQAIDNFDFPTRLVVADYEVWAHRRSVGA